MNLTQLTPAQKRFIEQFDCYTRRGTIPQEYQSLRDQWHVQHRTMNFCRRAGLLKPCGVEAKTGNTTFVVNPELREALGLAKQVFKSRLLRPRKRLSRAI